MAKKLDRLYIRVDAHFPRDERYQALPYKVRDSAYLFFEALNGWSRDKRTDGRVPLVSAHAMGREMEHPRAKVVAFLSALAAPGVELVRLEGDEVILVKYEKWQDTKAEIEGKQAAKQEAGRAGGIASGRSRREANASSTDEALASEVLHEDTKQTKHQTETETETETETATGLRPSAPPLPSPRGGPQARQPVLIDAERGLDEFLDVLADATGRVRRPASAKVRNLYEDRRREGWTEADIVASARGTPLSKHHMGHNDLGVPLNDAAHVLGSAMFESLVGLGHGEIGAVLPESGAERENREFNAMVDRLDSRKAGELNA